MPTLTTPATAIAAVTMIALTISGCSAEDRSTPQAPTSPPAASSSADRTPDQPTATPEGPTLEVRIEGDSVAPNGAQLEVGTGEVLTVEVTSDRAGELHVHASPEQFLDFGEGTTTRTLQLEVPGVVEVEDHETSAVVAQIEVR